MATTSTDSGLNVFTNPPRPVEWLALAAILILAAILRMGAPGVVEFKTDEANLSERALDLVRGRDLPLLGIDSSVGVPNSPVSIYILAIPFAVSSNPLLATQFIGLLNVIAVGLLYAIARRYYGPLAAIVAGLLFAISPWAVIYSRKIWAQDMLPVFIMMTLGTGLLGFVEGKHWAQLLHLPLLAITGQIHYSTFVLLSITLYLLWVGRRRLSRAFLLSIPLTVIVVLPYVVGASRASLLSGDTAGKVITSGGTTSASLAFSDVALRDAAFITAGTQIDQIIAPQGDSAFIASLPKILPLLNALTLAVLIAVAWIIIRMVRCRDARTPIDISFLLLLIITPAAFLLTWTHMNVHYLIPMIPAAFLVIGAGAGDLWRVLAKHPARTAVFGVGAAIIAVIVVLQVGMMIAVFDYVNTHTAPPDPTGQPVDYLQPYLEGFGTPLGYYLPMRDAILASHLQNLLANLDGQYVGYHEETTIWNTLLDDIPTKRFLDGNTDVYPTEPAVFISHNCTASTRNYTLRPGEPCYAVSTRGPGDLDLSAFTKTNDAGLTFANHARINAYRWEPVPAGCLSVTWTINGPPIKEDFSFFVHFINAQGREILFADDLSWRGRYWRPGDTVIKRFCLKNGLERINEIVGVRIGMDLRVDAPDGPKFYNQDLYDASGVAVGQYVEIRLKKD